MYKTIISAIELNRILNKKNTVTIDCRFFSPNKTKGKNEYLISHIPNAHYAHLDDDLSSEIIKGKTGRHPLPDINVFSEKCGEWGIDEKAQVVVYDQSHGGIAARLWFLLKWLGHENVALLNGGWEHWSENGFPISNKLPEISEKEFRPNEKGEKMVSIKKVGKIFSDPNFLLVDSRSAERYRGENEPFDPVAGHIPGAASAPFLDNLGEDGLFLNKEKLIERFEKLLAGRPPKDVVFYCGSGVTACHNLLALEHIERGGQRLYPGSWSEWIADEKRPVETFIGDK